MWKPADQLLADGPHPKEDIMRMWKQPKVSQWKDEIVVIMREDGMMRFSVPTNHPHYAHYQEILMNHADHSGWVTPPRSNVGRKVRFTMDNLGCVGTNRTVNAGDTGEYKCGHPHDPNYHLVNVDEDLCPVTEDMFEFID
jgi:hypothetical protein